MAKKLKANAPKVDVSKVIEALRKLGAQEKEEPQEDGLELQFYIFHVGGEYALHHRATHFYLQAFKEGEEKELAEVLEKTFKITPEELWRYLILKGARIPSQRRFGQETVTDNEKWFRNTWKRQTEQFEEKFGIKFPRCENRIPYEIVNKVNAQVIAENHAKITDKDELEKQLAEERRLQEKNNQRESKAERLKRTREEERREREGRLLRVTSTKVVGRKAEDEEMSMF